MTNQDFKPEFHSTPDTASVNDNLSAFLLEYRDTVVPDAQNGNDKPAKVAGEISRLNEILLELRTQQEQSVMPGWLTSEQVQSFLNLKERSLRTLRKSGKLPSSQVGQKFFYRKEDVDLLLNEAALHKQSGD